MLLGASRNCSISKFWFTNSEGWFYICRRLLVGIGHLQFRNKAKELLVRKLGIREHFYGN